MASVFELKFDNKHGVAESTLMLATMSGGHFYNMVSDVDIDNGSVSVLDITNWKEEDVFGTQIPAKGDKVVLILTAPKIYEEYAKQCQEECYFYNGAGERMRAYEVYATDRFALSAEAFSDDAAPAVGQYVMVDGTGYKLTTGAADDATCGFMGYIYDVATNGNFKVFVIRNEKVA